MDTTDTTKICSRCSENDNVKPRSEFFKNKGYKDGLYPYCKACHATAEARPERVAKRKAYKSAYHMQHAAAINARTLQWQKDNPEKANAKNRRSKAKHKETILAKEAVYREKYRDACNARRRKSRSKKPLYYAKKGQEWRQAHPNKLAEYAHKRRALLNSIPFIEEVDIEILFQRDKGICGICHKKVRSLAEASRDHIIPVTVAGSEHSYRNMVLAHKSCNSEKGNRTVTQQMRLF
jgi:5-methylcytosine-specific restriction endonuclease McrA